MSDSWLDCDPDDRNRDPQRLADTARDADEGIQVAGRKERVGQSGEMNREKWIEKTGEK